MKLRKQCDDPGFTPTPERAPATLSRGAIRARLVWGFTLTEVLIVIGIIIVLISVAAPLVANNFRHFQFLSERDVVISLLRKARAEALTNRDDTNHGLYIASTSYVVFSGTSYETRDQSKDEDYPRNDTIAKSGLAQVVFVAFDATSASASLVLFDTPYRATISINEEGLISY